MSKYLVLVTGFSSAAVQVIFLREYLTIFSGNELTIGMVFALWLLFSAIGSRAGKSVSWPSLKTLNLLYVISVLLGFSLARATRLFFLPGEMISPWIIPLIIGVTQSDAAFFGGLVYGKIATQQTGQNLYRLENLGSLLGLIAITIGILLKCPNGIVLGMVLTLFTIAVFIGLQEYRSFVITTLSIGCIVVFAQIDSITVSWKYPGKVHRIFTGTTSEIAERTTVDDTLIFINNSLYRNKLSLPSIEQTVHIPMGMHATTEGRRVLVIGDQGYVQELEKYKNIDITCIESEKVLAKRFGCLFGDVFGFFPKETFDVIIISGNFPVTAQLARYYTKSFFEKLKKMAGETGIVSFTLPFAENYLSENDNTLKNCILQTLSHVFYHVVVIPGTGYTFCASDTPLHWPVNISVPTRFLADYTLPSISENRFKKANTMDSTVMINAFHHPIAMYFAQKQWLGIFGATYFIYLVIAFGIAGSIAVFVKAQPSTLSIASTGFVSGFYSVALMIFYQFNHGTLFTDCSLLLLSMASGFIAGTKFKRMPYSDLIIGIYAGLSITILVSMPMPGLIAFCAANFGMGLLSAAQFITRNGSQWNFLYAADLFGGMLGMLLAASIIIPYFGIIPAVIGIVVIKALAEILQHQQS